MRKILSLTSFLLLSSSVANAQLIISPGGGAPAVTTAVGGPGLTISNVNINCAGVSYGSFSGGAASGLGITAGLVLTTGDATQIIGANTNNDFTGGCVGTSANDPDLVALSSSATKDVCIIEFDVIPECTNMSITFIFGSDEYTDYVNSSFNDAFGFFVSGPNPGGGTYSNMNIATIPGGTSVSIDNVSHLTNTTYFINNNAGTFNNSFDGFTTVLTPTINVTPCATYHFKLAIADATDCAMDSGVMIDIIQCTSPWTVATSSTPSGCAGPTGSATATVSGGIGPFTYAWVPSGGSGSTASSLPAGSYTVTVNDALTCTPAQTYTVVVGSTGATSTVTVPPNSTVCNGATVAATAFTSTPGGGTFTWTNSNPAIGVGASGSGNVPSFVATNGSGSPISGTFTVTPTVAGCVGTPSTYTITVNPTPVTTVNSTTICPGQSATLTASGGTTYSWSNGAVTNPITVSPGTTTSYTVTGTTGGCSSTAVATVTVAPALVINVNQPTICAGQTANLSASGATTYTWSAGATSTGVNTADASPISTTTYTVTGFTGGCSGTATSTVTVNPTPVITVNSPSTCAGTSVVLSANGGTIYSWSNGSLTNPITVSPATTTSYTVTGTALGCSGTAVATVTVNSTLTVDAGLNDTICFGESTTLNVIPNGAGYSYVWTPSAGLSNASISNPVANPTTTTNYTVNVTDVNGCSGSDNVTIYSNSQINPTIASQPASCNGVCDGQAFVIPGGGSGSYTFLWSNGSTNAAPTGLCTGTYTVIITDSWLCTADTSITVTEPPVLTIAITGTTPTTCSSVCDGTANSLSAGGNPGHNYSWNTIPVQLTANATALCAGNYTVTVTDSKGCTATANTTIIQPAPVVISPMTNAVVCTGGNTTLNASVAGGDGVYTYSWTPAGSLSNSSISNPVASPASTTTYTLNVTDGNGCNASPEQVTVTVNPFLTVVTAGSASVCPGTPAPISATGSNGNGGPYTYSWSPATGLSNSSISNPTATPTTTTTYTVTVTDGCSPPVTATVTVTILPLPAPAYSPNVTSGCAPLCVTFTDASLPAGGVTAWSWNFGDGSSSVDTNETHCYTTPGQYTVALTVTGSNGCTATLTNVNQITVNPVPIASFTAPLSTSIFTPTVQFTDNSTGASSWSWDFGDVLNIPSNTSSLQHPEHTYSETGTYCITLTVSNSSGCTDVVSLCIDIDPEFTFYIPNAFSPNQDGINDDFYGKGEHIQDFEMFIYDRWGNMIFYADDINEHWTGKANHGSEIAQQDVYVYVVKIKDNKDRKHKYIGTVTLVK
ncbi:MAG: choice-of-anchor L domain-containing protein [Bacteroidota bacterium]|nr:choice-of-anchor L domain-containing protein [Bacteroidota bacterium]